MKAVRVLIVAAAVFFVQGSVLNAQSETGKGKGFGAGIVIGEPTGLSFKYNNFPVIGLAWSMIRDDFSFFCDYWVVNRNLKGPVDFYIGIGGKLKLSNDDHDNKDDKYEHGNVLGVRVPLGIQYFPVDKVELFAEIVPGIFLIPDTSADIDAGIGVRYYF